MSTNDVFLSEPDPFWFVRSELLADLMRAELDTLGKILTEYPDLRKLFDAPEATLPERSVCFALLAHRKVVDVIDEDLVSRYEDSPSLDDKQKEVLSRTGHIFAADAPAWVLEANQVAQLLRFRIVETLPAPLQTEGWYTNGSEKEDETKRLAATTLSTVDQIQTLCGKVIDQQWQRLEARWPPAVVNQSFHFQATDATRHFHATDTARERRKQRPKRLRDKQGVARDQQIAEIDDVAETPTEFLKIMDERKVKPQPTWSSWPGSWVEAYRNARLRKLIHQDKSRAIARARSKPKK